MMRTLVTTLAVVMAAPALAGEPILVPDFTPGSTSEFALAFMIQEKAIAQLERDGHIVLTSEIVRPVVGTQLDACDDVSWCPQSSLLQLPARVGLVVRVVRDPGRNNQLFARVKFYEEGDASPMDEWEYQITAGQEEDFALALSGHTHDLLSLLGPSPAQNLVEAVKLIEAAKNPQPEPRPDPVDRRPDPVPVEPPPPRPDPIEPPPQDLDIDYQDAPLAELLDGTDVKPRHLAGSVGTYRNAEMDVRDWMYKAMPHAGRVIVEVRGGLGIGDVSRSADVRVDLDGDGNTAAEWFQEGPQDGKAPRGALYVGYAPVTFMDIGALAGLQYGQKSLTTGWTQNGSGGASSSRDSVNAVQFYFQPRLRFYMAPTGPVKPYVVLAGEVKVFDQYKIVDPPAVDYPEPPGGIVPGAFGGGGLMIDPGPIVGFFVEGGYTRHFGSRANAAQKGSAPASRPEPPRGSEQTIGVAGGVQFRI